MGSPGGGCRGLRGGSGTAAPGLWTLPQDCFLSMTVSWYQSLIKVLLSRFPQSCRHFQSPDLGTQYLVSPHDPPLKGETQQKSSSEMTSVPRLTKPALPCRGLDGWDYRYTEDPMSPEHQATACASLSNAELCLQWLTKTQAFARDPED